MKFKSPELQDELHRASTVVQLMAQWFESLSIAHFKIEPTVTRVFERVPGATETHPEGRAVDIRDEHAGARVYTDEQVRFLTSEMNRRFPLDSGMLCCIHHSFQGGPLHFHIQISRALADKQLS